MNLPTRDTSTARASVAAAHGGFAPRPQHHGEAVVLVCLALALGIAALALRIAGLW